jgi:1,4-alpha-glucan branching enzyme
MTSLHRSAQLAPDEPDLSALRELPWLGPTYDETYLYLLPRDPQGLYALWEVSGPPEPGAALVLRVYDVTDLMFDGANAHAMFEVDDYLLDKTNYNVRVVPGRHYLAELGWRRDGAFRIVARSNTVFVPKGRTEWVERYVAWGHVPCDPNDVHTRRQPFDKYLNWKKGWMPEASGTFALVLHQHLPFVRHPEHEVALEEQWYFEAVVSVYTQLLARLASLEADEVDFRLTVSLTPSLLSMMEDPLLRERTSRHIDEMLALAIRERDRGLATRGALEDVVQRVLIARRVFDRYEGDLTRGYRHFQDLGKLEVITSAATHFLLPLHLHQHETVRAQIQLACRQYQRVFGRAPRGFWLPENAFSPGLDAYLAAEGIRWTLVSANSLSQGDTRCLFGTGRPVVSPAGVAFFGIDEATRGRIWSRDDGYPGDPAYKEWYRDLGHDLPWQDLPAYWRAGDVRRNTGIKVHKIGHRGTSLGDKELYDPVAARQRAIEHAQAFVAERIASAEDFERGNEGLRSCTVSAYDAELFGHWWEEGPIFLDALLRTLYGQDRIRPVTPSEACGGDHQRMMPGAASWGRGDYFQTWLEDRAYQPNDWIWRHVFRLSQQLVDLATRSGDAAEPLRARALNQAARCLCLAGASDWPFLIATGQATRYAEVHVVTHLDRARELLRQVEEGRFEAAWLATIEAADTLFPFGDMDYRVFVRG